MDLPLLQERLRFFTCLSLHVVAIILVQIVWIQFRLEKSVELNKHMCYKYTYMYALIRWPGPYTLQETGQLQETIS